MIGKAILHSKIIEKKSEEEIWASSTKLKIPGLNATAGEVLVNGFWFEFMRFRGESNTVAQNIRTFFERKVKMTLYLSYLTSISMLLFCCASSPKNKDKGLEELGHKKSMSYLLLPFENQALGSFERRNFLENLRYRLLREIGLKGYRVFDYFQYEHMFSVLQISEDFVTTAEGLAAAEILNTDAAIFCRVTGVYDLKFYITVRNVKSKEILFSKHITPNTSELNLAKRLANLIDRSGT